MLRHYKGKLPTVAPDAFIAEGAVLIGDVTIGDGASVWFNAVLRGDIAPVRVGRYSNVQDNSTLHVDADSPCIVGERVTIGHGAVVHGCTVGDNVLIGMNATILSHAVIGRDCVVGAGALVPEGREIPAGSLVLGVPARVVRQLTPDEIERLGKQAAGYVQRGREYRGMA